MKLIRGCVENADEESDKGGSSGAWLQSAGDQEAEDEVGCEMRALSHKMMKNVHIEMLNVLIEKIQQHLGETGTQGTGV
jgi:hypothetical protein